ncbi:MAG: EamA family transporter [Rhodobacteraceae bacterium]|nr:EamA family transporter [Paracoccaceae bacterium]
MALRAYGFLTLTALFWGANAVAGRLAVGHVSPFLLTAMRWALCFAAATFLARRHLRRDAAVLRRHAGLLFGLGAVGFTCFNALFYTAAIYTTALNIVILQAGMPLVIFAISFVLFRARVTGGQAAGFALTLAGVVVTAANGSLAALVQLHLNRGDALMLLAILCYGSYTAALRWKPPVHWLSFMAAISGAAFVTAVPLAAWEVARGTVIWPDARGWAIGAFTGVFPGLVAQASFIAGAGLIGSNRAGLFINLVPVFGAVLSVLVLGERLQPYHLVGLGLVLSGLALAERRRAAAA